MFVLRQAQNKLITLFVEIILFVVGICVGSFVNMLVYRTGISYKVIKIKVSKVNKVRNNNRSFCDFCGRQLSWYENIPIVSWLALGGKTKCCHNPLPWEYPFVEVGMGVLFILYSMKFELNEATAITFVFGLVILTMLIFSGVFDAKYMILPDFSTYLLTSIAMMLFWQNWITGALSMMFLAILHFGTKGKGMGMGDVKLALFMGVLLGFPKIVIAYYVAFVVGAIVGVGYVLIKKKKTNSKIPFGPFLILGTMVAWWWGDRIVYYLSRWF